MSAPSDSLRTTLDHLALDPKAKEDRKYLVSMLRRLGYTDAEIREALGVPLEGARVIEIEYRKGQRTAGAGAFSVVEEVEEVEEPIETEMVDFILRPDPIPEPEPEPEPEEVFEPLEDAWEPEEEPVWEEEPAEAVGFSLAAHAPEASAERLGFTLARSNATRPAMDPAVEHGWQPLDGDPTLHAEDFDNPWIVDDGEFAAAEPTWTDPANDETAPWDGETAEFDESAWPTDDAVVAPATTDDTAWVDEGAETAWPTEAAEPATEWAAPAQEETSWEDADESWDADVPAPAADTAAVVTDEYTVTDAPAGAWEAPAATPAAAPAPAPAETVQVEESFSYGDFGLYTRTVELSTGRQQRIYFFSKGAPKSGESCALPAGYIVEENAHTGLPFLRRDANAAEVATPTADATPAAPEAALEATQCHAVTKAGTQCKKAPLDGSEFCNIHRGRA